MLLEVTLRLLETFKLFTKQSLVAFGLGFKPLLQITEHLVVMFIVPQTGKQATKARFAVHDRRESWSYYNCNKKCQTSFLV